MSERIRLHDLMTRASPYLPIAVDVALRAEIMALCQDVDALREAAKKAADEMEWAEQNANLSFGALTDLRALLEK